MNIGKFLIDLFTTFSKIFDFMTQEIQIGDYTISFLGLFTGTGATLLFILLTAKLIKEMSIS